jgi:hypothetical protein
VHGVDACDYNFPCFIQHQISLAVVITGHVRKQNMCRYVLSWESTVSIATGYELDDLGVGVQVPVG